MRLSRFLATHFYHSEELCHALAIDEDTLAIWQQNGLFPKPSYCIKISLVVALTLVYMNAKNTTTSIQEDALTGDKA